MTSEVTSEMSFLSILYCNQLKASQRWPEKNPFHQETSKLLEFLKIEGSCSQLPMSPQETGGVKSKKLKSKTKI